MKRIPYLFLFSFLILSANSCKSRKKGKEATTVITNKNSNLIVSFYSPGNSIDYKTANEFVAFLDSYIPKISYTIIHWGREGETDYCIDLAGLNQEEQKTFKEKAKALVAKSDRVNVSENEKCREVRAED
jgi:hypothetical protein